MPPRLALNEWALEGRWTVREEEAVLEAAPGKVVMRFQARDLHLVLGPFPWNLHRLAAAVQAGNLSLQHLNFSLQIAFALSAGPDRHFDTSGRYPGRHRFSA